MGSKKYFITGVIVMTVLNGLDFLVTLKTIPSLEFEANPILDEFNLGWIGLLIFGIIYQLVLIIPFYFHCFVFNYPEYKYRKSFPSKFIWEVYFFRNDQRPYVSFANGVFNILAVYLFWEYVIGKIIAILNNILLFLGDHFFGLPGYIEIDPEMKSRFEGGWIYDIVDAYSSISPAGKADLLKYATIVGVSIPFLIFLSSIQRKARQNFLRERKTKRQSKYFIAFFCFFQIVLWILENT
ncbi:MAG: hypothetical protein IPP99_11080 [Chitinophagaceae bacterium]|nr:hypothetical protein [Chitinophagaceae bacterium]